MHIRRFAAALVAAALPIAALAVEPNTELHVVYSSAGGDPLTSAAIDIEGNLILNGARGNSSGPTSNSYYLAKYDSFGRELWTRSYSSGQGSYFGPLSSIETNRNGDIFMVLSESYVFGRIVRFDRDGNQQVLTPGESVPYNWEHGVGLALAEDGSIYMRAANTVRRYDANGALLWSKRLATHNASWVRDLKVDAAGNAYAVGKSWSTPTNTYDLYVAKFDASGNELWNYRYFNGNFSEGFKLRLDSSGDVVALGQGTTAQGDIDVVIVRLAPDGSLQAADSHDFGGLDFAVDFDLDEQDNVYALVRGNNDFVTAKFNPAGVLQWTARVDAGSDDRPGAIDVDVFGNVAVSGSTGYNYYGQQLLTFAYDTHGVQLWQRHETVGNSLGGWVQFGRTGEVYAGGWTLPTNTGDAFINRYRLCPCTSCQ